MRVTINQKTKHKTYGVNEDNVNFEVKGELTESAEIGDIMEGPIVNDEDNPTLSYINSESLFFKDKLIAERTIQQ